MLRLRLAGSCKSQGGVKSERRNVSEYHKIETLYERDEKTFKVKPDMLKNRTYSLLKSWHWTEKIDGTNIRAIWKPVITDGETRVRITNVRESLTFGGKTDNAQIHADLVKWLYENVSVERLREIFPTEDAVIYGEGYGAGI